MCGGKPLAVKKTTITSAACEAPDGKVPVAATAEKGCGIGSVTTTSYDTAVHFPDEAAPRQVRVSADDVTASDFNGASSDVLRLAVVDGATWQYAYSPAEGKPVSWVKAPAPKKGATESVIAVKAAKGATMATVYVRPRPVDADHASTGWTGDTGLPAAFAGAKVFTFTSSPAVVKPPTAAIGATTTLTNVPGVTAWQVEQTQTVSGKDRVVKTKVVVAPYASVVVQTPGTNVKVTPVPDKDHTIATA